MSRREGPHPVSDPLLRAFQENRTAGEGCAAPEEIWEAVAGRAGEARTASLVDHTIGCGDCARLWRLAREAQAGPEPTPVVVRTRPAARIRWGAVAGAGLAVAASLLLVLRGHPGPNPERGPQAPTIASATAPELPRGAFLLRWAPQGEGARYRVQVTLPDLTLIDSAAELKTPEHLVPESALGPVPSGGSVLWRVEARLPDGTRVASAPLQTRVR